MTITLASVVVPALIVTLVAGLCLGTEGALALTAKVPQGVNISSLADISVRNSTNNLLFSGIVAKVTEADAETCGRKNL